jgi:hypothetical protein
MPLSFLSARKRRKKKKHLKQLWFCCPFQRRGLDEKLNRLLQLKFSFVDLRRRAERKEINSILLLFLKKKKDKFVPFSSDSFENVAINCEFHFY